MQYMTLITPPTEALLLPGNVDDTKKQNKMKNASKPKHGH